MDDLFFRRSERHYAAWFYDLAADMFSLVQHWEPQISGPARGRLFEAVFHNYCDAKGLRVTERPGARTVRHERSGSGFSHETDAVIGLPNLSIHVEMKHLSTPLGKNELLIFNQKGIDHLLGGSEWFRSIPLYRLILSGQILTPEARRFAAQWGIVVVEPDRLPLLVLHGLAGRVIPGLRSVGVDVQDEIWTEIPSLLTPLQDKMRLFSEILRTGRRSLLEFQLERALNVLQRVMGDHYWMALDAYDPRWLERRFEMLNSALNLDGAASDRRQSPTRIPTDCRVGSLAASPVP